jgi:hypothetical protein
MTLKLHREVLGIATLLTLALTQCGPDHHPDESGDEGTSAAGGMDGEAGDNATGGSNRGGTNATGGSGNASGDAGEGGNDSRGGESGTDAGGSGPSGGSGGTDVNGGNAGMANGGSSTNGGSAGNGGSLGGTGGSSGGAGGTPTGGQGGSAGGGRGGTSGTSGTAGASSGGTSGSGGASGASGASATGGSGGATVWMPCPSPREPEQQGTLNGNSGSFGTTQAVCYRVTANFNAWACNNIGTHTVRVNGVGVMCTNQGTWPLPARVDGAYYFEFSAGMPDYTSFYWWVQ